MPNLTAEEAKEHFDRMLDDAQRDPIFISKEGEIAAVVLSWDAFKRVVVQHQPPGGRPIVEQLLANSIERHRDLFVALSKLD
jgi:hypothetical protein